MRYLIVMVCVVMGASALACDFCSIYTATEAKESKPGVYAGGIRAQNVTQIGLSGLPFVLRGSVQADATLEAIHVQGLLAEHL